jgi:cytochrome P450
MSNERGGAVAPVATDIETFEFWRRPRAQRDAAFRWLREHDPVSWHPPIESHIPAGENASPHGFWAVVKYRDIQEISRHPQVFSATKGIWTEDMPPEAVEQISFIAMDAPAHTRIRGIVQTAFSPRNIRKMEQWIDDHVKRAVGRVAALEAGEGDLVAELTKPMPGEIFADYLGVRSVELRDRIIGAAEQMISWDEPRYAGTMSPMEVMAAALAELNAIALELVAERRAQPRDDMVSWLVHAEFDGARMTDHEIACFFSLLAGAANDTTGQNLAHSLWLFQQHPDQKALLIEDFDAHVETAVEECLRLRPPILSFQRRALADHELRGTQIRKGDKLVMWYQSGSRDGDIFELPDAFDITRPNAHHHQAFGGGGPHFCIGAALARWVNRRALPEIYRQMPDLSVDAPSYLPGPMLDHIVELPARWTAGRGAG